MDEIHSSKFGRRRTILGSIPAADCVSRRTRSRTVTTQGSSEDAITTPTKKTPLKNFSTQEAEEIQDEDGFKYKRRKKNSTKVPEVDCIAEPVGEETKENQPATSDAPPQAAKDWSSLPEYPVAGTTAEEEEDEDNVESVEGDSSRSQDERLLQVVESVCSRECDRARSAYPAPEAQVAHAVEEVLAEFQLKVEQMVVDGGIQFKQSDNSGVNSGSESLPSSELDARKQALRSLIQRYSEEDAEWELLLQQCHEPKVSAESAELMKVVASSARQAAQRAGEQKDDLEQVCVDTHRKLVLQMDALKALARRIEETCDRVEAVGHEMAAKEEQAFKNLPHLSSPHELIRQLTAGASNSH